MPTPMARFSESGTAFMIASRRPTRTSTRDDDAFPDDDAHRAGQAQAGAEREPEGDDAVDAQAGGDRDRVVREQAHQRSS